MDYAADGTLQNYLKENFENLTWSDKLNLAFQLVHVVHNEGIIHRDLVITFLLLKYSYNYKNGIMIYYSYYL
jgi:serine/threonine protein kinase